MNEYGAKSQFVIALPPAAAAKVETHVHIYTGKKLLRKVGGAAGVAAYVLERFGGSASVRESSRGVAIDEELVAVSIPKKDSMQRHM